MEIVGEDGSKTLLKKGFNKRELGRGLGFDSKDHTISRRHVSFELQIDENEPRPNSRARVHFEVIGKNPMWVRASDSDEIRVFRRPERGEMEAGDMFCVSAKKPIWFTLKRFGFEGEDESEFKRELENVNELAERSQRSRGLRCDEDSELDSIDVSGLDPVKEFGFIVMGHEFDHYPKKMIRHAKTWNWFLEEPKEDSEDDDLSDTKRKKFSRGKRKKAEGNDDGEWTGESEDDKEIITKSRKVQRPKYSTRSKDSNKLIKDTRITKRALQKKTIGANKFDEEDKDDDTLGGFIVKDDDVEEQEIDESEEEEEEEEEEDYDDDVGEE
ncbi:hypothetical protein U1Q18_026877 [Sarracenia purpurea var. burkii]